MPIQRTSPTEQIANELRARIEAGTYASGTRLPSDQTLAAEFGVSKPTVTKARTMLVALGLVDSRAGAASTVRDVHGDPTPPGNRLQRAKRTGRIYPEGHYAQIIDAQRLRATASVATALGVKAGATVIERHRVTCTADHAPCATSVSYFPAALARRCPALLKTERIEQGTTVYIEERTGRTATSLACTVSCLTQSAGPADATDLGLPVDTSVLAVATITYDGDGVAMCYEIELHPPDTPVTLDVLPA